MTELDAFKERLKDVEAKALPKGKLHSDMVKVPLDLYPHIKNRKNTHTMKYIGNGHIPYGENGPLNSEVIFPLEFHVFHDGNWDEPPIIFIHNLNDMEDRRRPLDVFNKVYVRGMFHAINQRVYDYVTSENYAKTNYLGVLIYTKDKLVELGTSYIASGHAENWVYMDGFSGTDFEIPKYIYKFVSHMPEFEHVKHMAHDIQGVYQDTRTHQVSKESFTKAIKNTIMVTENAQSIESTLALPKIDSDGIIQFHAVHHGFNTEALGEVLGLDFLGLKQPMTQTRQLFIKECKEFESIGRGNLQKAVDIRIQKEKNFEENLRKYQSLPWYKKMFTKKPKL
ncbi:hypothetical protein [Colwellia psychrerythraea]|uniref:Uncharacterized protein n=1 Tax=Colwellia psychrerythraea TaxID=28229 RepID=A0A099KDL4_COLPS|nr:hypothetical protein [Colwellia psychrerythraea]KGJ87633.1 hypothetical protein ND2E_4371 [Colwellia psychrerythraea]